MNFINRIKEPSSWAGFAALAVVFGAHQETVTAVVNAGSTVGQAVTAVAALLAIVLPEKKAA